MTDRPHYNPNQPRVPKGQEHGGEWTREGFRADSESIHDAPKPTLADLGISAGSGRGAMAVQGLPLIAAALAAIRAQAPRAAAALALREAARSQLGDSSISFGGAPSSTRTEVPRGTAADQAVLERFALFEALSERNNAEQVAVMEFKAGNYRRIGELQVTRVGVLSREQAEQFCPHLPTVQAALTKAMKTTELYNPGLRTSDPARFGSLVHKETAKIINASKEAIPNEQGERELAAEVYWLNGQEKKGGLGSVKSDAQIAPFGSDLFCIVDHKTGRKGLPPKRMLVLAAKASNQGRKRIIVMETRPFEGAPLEDR